MTTKQVNKIAIGENLFYDVIEEHIPFIIEKKAEAINNFFREMLSYIEEKTKKSDWFFMNDGELMYNNALVALFPNFNEFDIGHCPLNKPYDPSTFNNEYDMYEGSLMTVQEFKKGFAGKFDILLDICPEFFLDCYYTVVDLHRSYHSDGIRTKKWNGFSRQESYHLPICRLNGMDSENVTPAKTLYLWMENNLCPDELSDTMSAMYRQVMSIYDMRPECIKWSEDGVVLDKDMLAEAVFGGESQLISDKSDNSSFLYDPESKSIALDNLSKESLQIVKEHLLSCDALRADMDRYDENMLTDPGRGHWGLWQEGCSQAKYTAALDETLIARNPVADIRYNGVIGIDFGTKSTVVVYQDKTEHVLPMRIGTGHISKKAELKQYENPTAMELVDISRFLQMYGSKEGRPETLWEDLTISHSAVNSMINSTSTDYYSYFSELKQWAGDKQGQLRLRDKKGNDVLLPSFLDIKEGEFNPIEIYAYYIGLYINNMNNGIYLDYILSFPVTYEKAVCDKIIESFYRGLKKSLPESVLSDKEAMRHFRVSKGASEPAAYAICALEGYGFELEKEDKIYYGIFDFGGGTTDFDFGSWSNPSEEEKRKYDYVLDCFGGGGDQYLGGENLLELLSYEVFKLNQDKLLEDGITFAIPKECTPFPGSEALINDSQEARINMRQLMEQLRPFWEKKEDSESLYQSGRVKLALFTRTGEQKLNYELVVDTDMLSKILVSRIEKGIHGFFECMKETFAINVTEQIEKVHIFIAGNASRSQIVTDLFEQYMKKFAENFKETGRYKVGEDFFELHLPLGSETSDNKQKKEPEIQSSNVNIGSLKRSVSAISDIAKDIRENNVKEEMTEEEVLSSITKPNGKTGVAFGLIEGRPGGRIKIIDHNAKEDTGDINFRYYIGYKKKNKFCLVSGKDLAYNEWTFLCDASTEDFSFYYTSKSEAAAGDMDIFDVYKKNCRLSRKYNNAAIYYRAVAPTVIEYVVISDGNFNSDNYLENAIRIDLAK